MRFYVVDPSGKKTLREAATPERPGYKAVPVGTFQGVPMYEYQVTDAASVLRGAGAATPIPGMFSGKPAATPAPTQKPKELPFGGAFSPKPTATPNTMGALKAGRVATPGPQDTANILRRNGAKGFTPESNKVPNLFAKTEPNFFKPSGEHPVPLRSDTAMPDVGDVPKMGPAAAPKGKMLAEQNAPLKSRLKKKMEQKKPASPVSPPGQKSGLGAFDMSEMGNTLDEMKGIKPEDKLPPAPLMGELESQAPVQPVDPLSKFRKPEDEIPPEPSILQSAQSKTETVEDPLARMRGDNQTTPPMPTGGTDPRGIPWESRVSKTNSTQETIVDPETLARAKRMGDEGDLEAKKRYEDYLAEVANIGKNSPEQDSLKQERKDALARYTEGLDRSERSKFIDVLANNLGKIVGGAAGFATGTPVGKYYEYTPSGIGDSQALVAEKKYNAETGDIASRDKDIKDQQKLKLDAKEAATKIVSDLNKDGYDRLMRIMDLTKKVRTIGGTEGKDFISLENLGDKWAVLNFTQKNKVMADYEKSLSDNLQRKLDLLKSREGNETQLKVAEINANARVGGGENGTVVSKVDPTLKAKFDAAVGYGSANQQKFNGSGAFRAAEAKGDLEGAKAAVLTELQTMQRFADRTKNANHASFARILSKALPYITSMEQLKDLSTTLSGLSNSPGSPLYGEFNVEQRTQKGKGIGAPQETAPAVSAPAQTAPAVSGGQSNEKSIFVLEAALKNEKDAGKRAIIQSRLRELRGGGQAPQASSMSTPAPAATPKPRPAAKPGTTNLADMPAKPAAPAATTPTPTPKPTAAPLSKEEEIKQIKAEMRNTLNPFRLSVLTKRLYVLEGVE